MSDDIKELKSIASRLNESSDALNDSLNQINAQLNKMNIGLTVWLEDPPLSIRSLEDLTDKLVFLGYAKTSNGWGLAVKAITDEHGFYDGDPDSPYTVRTEGAIRPLMKTSRELRVEAIRLLPQLIELVRKRAESAVESIEIAKQLAAEL